MRKIVTLIYALVATSCLAQEPISDSTSYGACIMQNGSIVGINEDKPFAMHSVMKFPQALYVADYLSRKGLNLDDTIVVDKADLMQNTWSPMLKFFEGVKAFSYGELLELSLGQRRQAQSGREVHEKTWIPRYTYPHDRGTDAQESGKGYRKQFYPH